MNKDRFANRRQELNLSLTQIAQKVGVSVSTVARWESGNIANMRRDRIYEYAKILQVSPLWVMGIEPTSELKNFYDDVKALEEKYFDSAVELSTASKLDAVMACMLTVLREMPEMSAATAKGTVEYMRYLKDKEIRV